MRGPKRALKIRKLFSLNKDDDFRKYVNTYLQTFTSKDGKETSEAPKIQRLVTPLALQRKRTRISKRRRGSPRQSMKLLNTISFFASRMKEQRDSRSESFAKKRSRLSTASKPSIAT